MPPDTYAPVDTGDAEARQIAHYRNRALFLRRTATTDWERTVAEQARDAYVDRLGEAMDREFAERDRRWATHGYDDPGAARREERAVQLLDEYNAEVQEQRAESDRRRAENLARYRVEQDEPWMRGRDAARSPQPLPPAADPYRAPRTPHPAPDECADTPTTPSPGGSGMPNIDEARANIMTAHRSAEQGLDELAQAHSSLQDAQNGLRHGTEGSNQPEADQAHAQLADAINKIDEVRQQVAAALQEFEGVAQRL